MPKLYKRNQGGKARYYGDLRDIGGGQVALKPPGSSRATTSETEALSLLRQKIDELQGSVATPTSGSTEREVAMTDSPKEGTNRRRRRIGRR